MIRFLSISAVVAALCTLQSGCCCCRLPAFRPPPVVIAPGDFQPPKDMKPPQDFNKPPQDLNPPKDGNPPKTTTPPDKTPPPSEKKTYQYLHNTGQFKVKVGKEYQLIGMGFSGKGDAKDHPESYKERGTGIMPIGDWRVSQRRTDPKTGDPIFDLQVFTGGVPNERQGETFTIHSDKSPTAGESGFALPRNVLDMIEISKEWPGCIIEVRTDQKAPPRPKTYVYSQSTGKLTYFGDLIGTGYSGKGKGKNNPAMQDVKDIGPVPAGLYEIIMQDRDKNSQGFGDKLKLNPTSDFTKRWPGEDIWIATETLAPGNHPAIFIVFPTQVVNRIGFRDNPKNRIKVVP
jgi:hypothetical protein